MHSERTVNHVFTSRSAPLSLAAALALLGSGAAVCALIAGLSLVLPVWGASIIVAAALFGLSGIAASLKSAEGDRTP